MKEVKIMSESKKLSIGTELTDDELMEMTGGGRFRRSRRHHHRHHSCGTVIPAPEYGIGITDPEVAVKYGVTPDVTLKYGIIPELPQPLYGILIKE